MGLVVGDGMTDILGRLRDLHKQATEERSHNYVGACVRDAIAEIELLRAQRVGWMGRELELLRKIEALVAKRGEQ